MANDTPIEFGPGIHGIDEITYLYVREPGGHRIEINSGGWENYHAGLGADDLERAPGRHDAVEEPGDAGVDDGVLAGRRRHARADADRRSCSSSDEDPGRRRRHRRPVGDDRAAPRRLRGRRRREEPGVGRVRRRDHPAAATRCGRCNELGLAEACVAAGPSDQRRRGLARRRPGPAGRQRLAGARAGAAAGQRDHAPAAAQDPPDGDARVRRRRAHRRDRDLARRREALLRPRDRRRRAAFADPRDALRRHQAEAHRPGVLALQPAAHRRPGQDLGLHRADRHRGLRAAGGRPDVHAHDREAAGGRAAAAAARGPRGHLPRAAGGLRRPGRRDARADRRRRRRRLPAGGERRRAGAVVSRTTSC